MSHLQVMAREMGMSVRTVQRRCEKGLVPGAFRAKKGAHWKINLELWREINRLRSDPTIARAMSNGKLAFEFTMVANGISNDDVGDWKSLKARDPEKYRYLYERPYRVHPRAYDALEHPRGTLMMKAGKLRLNNWRVTRESLARELGISVATLYRRYKLDDIRLACSGEVRDVQLRGQRGHKVNRHELDEKFVEQLADCRRW